MPGTGPRKPRVTLDELRRPLPWGPPPPIKKQTWRDREAMRRYLQRSWIAYRRSYGATSDDD